MATRLRECSEATAKGRLRKAEQFLEHAAAIRDLAGDEDEVGDVFVSLCVLAGIAADRKRAWRKAESLVEAARSR